jgi:hypothetical protein
MRHKLPIFFAEKTNIYFVNNSLVPYGMQTKQFC